MASAPAADQAESADAGRGAPSSASPSTPDRSRFVALALAVVFLFPMLGKSGIWDPYELDAADLARRVALRVFGASSLEMKGAINVLPTLTDLKMGELPFTSMALGFRVFGLHDWTGRLPLALWGLAGVMVLYELLARLVDRRAGVYAALALVTMPLYFIQARTMLGDIVTMSAMTIAFAGLLGGLADDERRLPWLLLAGLGLAAGYLSRGAIIGVAVPALGVGLTWVVLRATPAPSSDRVGGGPQTPGSADRSLERDLAGAGSLLVGLGALGYGAWALHGATPEGVLSRAVGFAILKRAPLESTFDLVIRQLGHALFPWSALLPFALGRVLRAPVEVGSAEARERETTVRLALVVGTAVAYGAFALLAPKSGVLAFSGPALLAAVVGIVVLDFERGAPPSRALALGTIVLAAILFTDMVREQDKALAAFVVEKPQFPKTFEATGTKYLKLVLVSFVGFTTVAWIEGAPKKKRPSIGQWVGGLGDVYRAAFRELADVWNGNLVFALVVVEAALVGLGAMILIGKRISWAPVDKLSENVSQFGTHAWWLGPAVLAALPLLVVAARDGSRAGVASLSRFRLSRATLTMVAAIIAGGVLSFGYFPGIAAQLSPKEAFESYARLSHPGEPLALLSVRSRAAAYYGGGDAPSFTDANQGFAWLTEHPNERRWMLIKADDLPKVNSLYRGLFQKNLPVLDGRSSQILLVSSELGDHVNENSLGKVVLDEPIHPVHALDVMFEDQLNGIGWEVTDQNGKLVDSVVPATTYHLRTYYRVVKPIAGTWKAFVHIDGFQRRYNGDHAVVDGKYAMPFWKPGDVVVDDCEFALEPNFTPGSYTLYFGFFSSGDTRYRVSKGANHENRVVAGQIEVR